MFDAMKLLGSMAENLSGPSAANRFGGAVQQGANSGGLQQMLASGGPADAQQGGLNSFLSGLANRGGPAGSQPASSGLGGLLGSFAELASRAASSPRQEVQNNNPAAVGGLGALAGALLGGGRGAMGGGLMAVLGSLAYSALQSQTGAATMPGQQPANGGYGQMPSAAIPPTVAPSGQSDASRKALLMTRAMIQAAKADGVVDQQEMQRIMGKLGDHGHDQETREFIAREMSGPIDIAGLARDVTTPQEAAEVYAASIMSIEIDTQGERDYLADLAATLRLPGSAVAQIHAALGVPA